MGIPFVDRNRKEKRSSAASELRGSYKNVWDVAVGFPKKRLKSKMEEEDGVCCGICYAERGGFGSRGKLIAVTTILLRLHHGMGQT
ncbi:hypothetical protein SESBI_33993 [Sesbania bispinosa]|nr:hypothetical protein SESBI_33993 [Sesbania bispinosa]